MRPLLSSVAKPCPSARPDVEASGWEPPASTGQVMTLWPNICSCPQAFQFSGFAGGQHCVRLDTALWRIQRGVAGGDELAYTGEVQQLLSYSCYVSSRVLYCQISPEILTPPPLWFTLEEPASD